MLVSMSNCFHSIPSQWRNIFMFFSHIVIRRIWLLELHEKPVFIISLWRFEKREESVKPVNHVFPRIFWEEEFECEFLRILAALQCFFFFFLILKSRTEFRSRRNCMGCSYIICLVYIRGSNDLFTPCDSFNNSRECQQSYPRLPRS